MTTEKKRTPIVLPSLIAAAALVLTGLPVRAESETGDGALREIRELIGVRQSAPCAVGRCPTSLTFVDACSCGAERFERKRSAAMFCCHDMDGDHLSPKICSDSNAKRARMDRKFCTPEKILEQQESRPLIIKFTLTGTATLEIHRALVPYMEKVRARLEKIDYHISGSSSGGYAANRNSRGTDFPSPHAYAIAIDLNWDQNLYCPTIGDPKRCGGCATAFVSNLPAELIGAFEAEGFEWGGRWVIPDPMHFELKEDRWPRGTCDDWLWEAGARGGTIPTVSAPRVEERSPVGNSPSGHGHRP